MRAVSPEAPTRARFLALRRQVFEAAFVGYAAYYLVRTNLPPVAKELGAALGYDKAALGQLLALSGLSYGVGKFLLGALSDRSNARWFMPLGLLLSAACNVAFARFPSLTSQLWLWSLNGFVQGMGWAPCGRILAHWFGPTERGRAFGFWNVSHNVGAALVGPLAAFAAGRWGWQSAFYVPAALALLLAGYLLWRLRDTPASEGLPGPEVFENEAPGIDATRPADAPPASAGKSPWVQVLGNPWMWLLASANFFAYVIRYALLDWGPTFLKEARGATLMQGGWSTFAYEAAAILGTVAAGWLTDRLGGRRAFLGMLCVLPMAGAGVLLVSAPVGWLWASLLAFAVVGFCIYPLLMLFTVIGLDLTSQGAIGTAAGWIGLFGYLGKGAQAVALGWLAERHGWDAAILAVGATLAVELLLLLVLSRQAKAPALSSPAPLATP